jgi:hypothetical protein
MLVRPNSGVQMLLPYLVCLVLLHQRQQFFCGPTLRLEVIVV